jgi:uncharacterized protein
MEAALEADRIAAVSENSAPQREQHVGSVLSVRGAEASFGILRRNDAATESHGTTVGKFLAIASKNSLLIGFVTEVSVEVPEIVREQGYAGSARLELMGEIRKEGHGTKFRRGVTEYPLIGDPVVTVSADALQLIFGRTGAQNIVIGRLQQEPTLAACVQVDEMLSRHFAVFGTTGVGKSSGVAVLLQQVLKARPNLRIFLLDAHNEYARCFGDLAHVVNPGNLKLPFWLFNFEELVDVIFGGRSPGVEDEFQILAELIPIAKSMYVQYQTVGSRTSAKKLDSKNTGFTVDTPVPYRLADLVSLIDDRLGKLENRASRMKYFKLIMRIEAVSNDPRYNFMFENANVGGDTMAEVICHLFRIAPGAKPMTVMQLAGLPVEVVDSVVSVVGRMAFEFGLWSDGAFPILFFCEEAHRYASADRALGFGPTRRALSRIAKEGRKCGVFLGLASQRPAELDATIISQCSTLFVMRMANDRDQKIIRSAVSDAAASLVNLVSSLGTREVLAFGEGVSLPVRMVFADLPKHLIPSSEAVRNTHAGATREAPHDHVDMIVARWRGASINNKHLQFEETPSAPAAPSKVAPPSAKSVTPQPSLHASAPEHSNDAAPQQSLCASVLERSSILKKNVSLRQPASGQQSSGQQAPAQASPPKSHLPDAQDGRWPL